MNTITEFAKTYKNNNSSLKFGQIKYIKEQIGPENDRGLCQFAYSNNEYIQTVPHLDIFKTEGDNRTPNNGSDSILLSGTTLDIVAKYYDDDHPDTDNDIIALSQYFLENKTRDQIQYLIWWEQTGDVTSRFTAFVPGLITSEDGSVLGFLHSYIANENNKVTFEIPYEDYEDGVTYTFTGTGISTPTQSRNNYIITISQEVATPVYVSNGSKTAKFIIFPHNRAFTNKNYRVKVANEYGDYTVAAQLTEHNSIKEVVDKLSETTMAYFNQDIGYAPLPKTFKSLALVKFAESVNNITPNMYKVPVTFVPMGASKVFMADVTGISTNKVINRN